MRRISKLILGLLSSVTVACSGGDGTEGDPSSGELKGSEQPSSEATPAGEELAATGEIASDEAPEGSIQTLTHDGSRGNGSVCVGSIYNCKLRPSGGNRLAHVDNSLDWGVERDVEILDGNGDVLGINKTSTIKINYGTRRTFNSKRYIYAMSTTNKSSAWFPLDAVKSADVVDERLGNVVARVDDLKKMACYEVRNDMDETLASKKVVYDTKEPAGPVGEAAGDYLARVRANGKRSINLAFSVPGLGLGSPAVDHFPAGTKFQRLEVPTDRGLPSLDIKLYSAAANGHFTVPAGVLKFIYGYVVSKTGDRRAGWIAYDALKVSEGCL